jgi:hypothetical protein
MHPSLSMVARPAIVLTSAELELSRAAPLVHYVHGGPQEQEA